MCLVNSFILLLLQFLPVTIKKGYLHNIPTELECLYSKILPFPFYPSFIFTFQVLFGSSEEALAFLVQAGAMMIVGFLASRATLASKLIQDLIIFIGRAAQQDAKESGDLPWLRLSVMTIICLVQVICHLCY